MEYLYALYLISGIIKSFLNFFSISLPVDVTLLISVLLTAGLVFDGLKKKYSIDAKSFISTNLLMLFFLWLNITILYSPSSVYSYQKSFLFLTNILAFLVPLFYKGFDYSRFLKFLIILTPFLGVLFLVNYAQIIYSTSEEDKAFEVLYLSLPQIGGLCLIATVVFNELFSSKLKMLIIILTTLTVILAGGRGPIIFTAIVLISYGLITYLSNIFAFEKNVQKPTSKSVKKGLIFFILLSTILLILISSSEDMKVLFDRSYGRLSLLFISFTEGHDPSDRITLFESAGNYIFDNVRALIIGNGLGSYGVLVGNVDGRYYPHNIILEIWFEAGLIGVILFSVFFIYSCGRRITTNPFTWLVLFIFLNAMKSGGLEDMRLFFGFLALLGAYAKNMSVARRDVYKIGMSKKHLATGDV